MKRPLAIAAMLLWTSPCLGKIDHVGTHTVQAGHIYISYDPEGNQYARSEFDPLAGCDPACVLQGNYVQEFTTAEPADEQHGEYDISTAVELSVSPGHVRYDVVGSVYVDQALGYSTYGTAETNLHYAFHVDRAAEVRLATTIGGAGFDGWVQLTRGSQMLHNFYHDGSLLMNDTATVVLPADSTVELFLHSHCLSYLNPVATEGATVQFHVEVITTELGSEPNPNPTPTQVPFMPPLGMVLLVGALMWLGGWRIAQPRCSL